VRNLALQKELQLELEERSKKILLSIKSRPSKHGKVQLKGLPAGYTEGTATAKSSYDLDFDIDAGTFSGRGSDEDGAFYVENGVFSLESGELAWAELTPATHLYTIVFANLVGSTISGSYSSSTRVKGNLSISNCDIMKKIPSLVVDASR